METLSRKSVALDKDLAELADALRKAGSPERIAVESMVGPLPTKLSEAGALTTLLSLAREVVQEMVLAAQYESYAAARDGEDIAFQNAVKVRRTRRFRDAY